jgi:putative flippase GtrA
MNETDKRNGLKLIWRIKNKFVRFIFVGIINTVFGYGMFIFFIWTGLHYAFALLFSQILGMLFNYKTTGYLVFESRSNRLILRFILVYGVMYFINWLELYLLDCSPLYETLLGSPYLSFLQDLPLNPEKIGDAIGQAIVVLPNALLSFVMFQTFVFKK